MRKPRVFKVGLWWVQTDAGTVSCVSWREAIDMALRWTDHGVES